MATKKMHWWDECGVTKASCGKDVFIDKLVAEPRSVTCLSCLRHALKLAELRTDEAKKTLGVAETNESDIRLRIKTITNELSI